MLYFMVNISIVLCISFWHNSKFYTQCPPPHVSYFDIIPHFMVKFSILLCMSFWYNATFEHIYNINSSIFQVHYDKFLIYCRVLVKCFCVMVFHCVLIYSSDCTFNLYRIDVYDIKVIFLMKYLTISLLHSI